MKQLLFVSHENIFSINKEWPLSHEHEKDVHKYCVYKCIQKLNFQFHSSQIKKINKQTIKMSEVPAVEVTPAPASPPKKVAKVAKSPVAAKKPKAKATHPPTGEMVVAAVKTLKERGGSSLQAIKKYLAANYKVDCEKLAPFIKKFLKSAVASGQLLQTKGKGASGSFKLPAVAKKAPAVKKVVKKPVAAKKTGVKKVTKKSVSKSPKKASSPTKLKKPVAKKLTEKKAAVAKAPAKKPVVKAKVAAVAKPKAAPKKVVAPPAPKKTAVVAPKKVAAVPATKKAAATKKPAAKKVAAK